MALSLKQLTTPVTEDEALAEILETLEDLGFQATSWQSGGVQRTIVHLFARVYSDLTETVSDIAKSGFAKLATGVYQDYLGQHSYNLTRNAATATLGQMVLTSSAAAPIHTWDAGELLVADAEDGDANTYEVMDAGVLNPGTSVTVLVRATVAGNAGNIAPNVALFLWTPLVGVTASNPAISGASTWITTPGTDAESDARYADRMLGRWDRLTYGNTEGAYRAWALEALPSLTRVKVSTGSGGLVYVTGATATGGLDAAQIQTITDHINGIDGIGRRPINDVLIVQSATAVTSPDVALTVTVDSIYAAGIAAKVNVALVDLFGSLDIGGTVLPALSGRVLLADLYAAVMSIEGVRNVVFASPAADVSLPIDGIYTPVIVVNVVAS
jgi:uncharacterized phage protein gp47/JayE